MKRFKILCIFVLIIFNSCIGISMDIQMNKDGSGRVNMEYRISQVLENLGAFDGNESRPAIPLSREDWNRTVERNPGLKLVSYSSKKNKQDTVTSISLDFKNEEALLSFLDPIGEKTSIKRQGNSGTLEMILIEDSLPLDENELNLARMLVDGYNISISFKAAGNSSLAITDSKGNTMSAPSSSEAVLAGKKVSLTAQMADMLDLKNGFGLKFTW